MNRKKNGGAEFVVTARRLEKVALNMMDLRAEGKYVLVCIDYFTRLIESRVLAPKAIAGVVKTVDEWYERGIAAEKYITDNGKAVCGKEFKDWCTERKVQHRIVSVESHRSNGRVERVIGTIREGLMKNQKGTTEKK